MIFNLEVACGLFSLSKFLLNSVILLIYFLNIFLKKRKMECFKMLTGSTRFKAGFCSHMSFV